MTEPVLPCRENDPELWFSDTVADAFVAQRLCMGCPVRLACLQGALDRKEPWGVWGGVWVHNGQPLARRIIVGKRRVPAPV